MKVVLGTRGSKLALAQCELVKQQLKKGNPDWDIEIKTISTKGDRIQNLALDKMGDKGLFVSEIEQEILSGQIQIGVHSLKDLASELAQGLCLTKSICGETWQDALVLKEAKSLADLPHGSVIATGSKRRKFQLLALRPDLKVVDIRGNIDTRLKKMEEGQIDGLILAAAGLRRLHLQDRVTHYFSEDEMVPSCGQGILALEIREDQIELKQKIEALSDPHTTLRMECERAYLSIIGQGCHAPVGALALVNDQNQVEITAYVANEQGTSYCKRKVTCPQQEAIKTMKELAQAMKQEVEECS